MLHFLTKILPVVLLLIIVTPTATLPLPPAPLNTPDLNLDIYGIVYYEHLSLWLFLWLYLDTQRWRL